MGMGWLPLFLFLGIRVLSPSATHGKRGERRIRDGMEGRWTDLSPPGQMRQSQKGCISLFLLNPFSSPPLLV